MKDLNSYFQQVNFLGFASMGTMGVTCYWYHGTPMGLPWYQRNTNLKTILDSAMNAVFQLS